MGAHVARALALWLGVVSAGGAAAAEADPAAAARGRALYQELCADCHGARAGGGNGPDIVGTRAEFIREAAEGVEDMPEIDLTEAQINALAAWLARLALDAAGE